MIAIAKLRSGNIIPISYDWKTKPQIDISYKTEIRQFRSGVEERDCLRLFPRVSIRFTGIATADLARRFKTDMMFLRNSDWVVKYPVGTAMVIAPVNPADTEIELIEIPNWLRIGSVVVLESDNAVEAVTVSAIVGSIITVSAVVHYHAAMNTRIHRAYPCRISGDPQLRNITESSMSVSLTVEILANAFVTNDTDDVFAQYLGKDLFVKTPNWGDSVSTDTESQAELIDFDFGVTSRVSLYDFPEDTISATYYGMIEGEIDMLMQFAKRRLGRRNSFWFPSKDQDFRPTSNDAKTQPYLIVAGDWYDNFIGSKTHNRVIAFFSDGTYSIRELTGNLGVAPSGETSLELTSAFGVKFDMNTTKVRWLNLRRLASDSLTFEYLSDLYGSVTLPMSILPTSEVE